MISLQERLAAILSLAAQLSELDELRERIRKAELARRLPQVDRRIERSISKEAARHEARRPG
jgi:hypothetical protein